METLEVENFSLTIWNETPNEFTVSFLSINYRHKLLQSKIWRWCLTCIYEKLSVQNFNCIKVKFVRYSQNSRSDQTETPESNQTEISVSSLSTVRFGHRFGSFGLVSFGRFGLVTFGSFVIAPRLHEFRYFKVAKYVKKKNTLRKFKWNSVSILEWAVFRSLTFKLSLWE